MKQSKLYFKIKFQINKDQKIHNLTSLINPLKKKKINNKINTQHPNFYQNQKKKMRYQRENFKF